MLARRKPLQRTYLRQILISLGSYAMLYGVSQWMEQSRGLSASVVGLVLIPLSVLSIIVARFVSGRGWIRWPLVLSGAALIGAAAVGVFITDQSPIWVLIGMSLLVGLTSGLGGFANQAALYIETPADEIAVGSGLLRTSTNVAAIFSSSIIGLSFGAIATDGGLHVLSLALAVIGIALVLLSVLDRRIPANANPPSRRALLI
jgi:MFS family permease